MKSFGNHINPQVLVIGCFHGDEPQGKYLIEKYLESNNNTKLIFVPCLNEYGFLNNIRTNRNGVDLNRNFPTKNWKKTEKNNFFGGDFPASESETRFIIELVEKYNPKIILSLHAPYKVVNYDGEYNAIIDSISEIMHYPVEPSIGYPTPGSFGTWAGVEKGITTITLELDEEIDIKELETPIFRVLSLLEEVI